MKIRNLICLLILLKSIPSQAYQRDTIRLFYNINKKELTIQHKHTLDSLSKFISDTTTVSISGFADYLGKRNHNYTLSNERALMVKNYLLMLHSQNANIIAAGKGQVDAKAKHHSPLGEPFNRRVDIIITIPEAPVIKVAVVPLKDSVIINKPIDSVYTRINNLPNMDIGDSVSFSELTFLPGRHFLRSTAWPYLVALKEALKNHQNLKIEIQGHICCQYDNKDGLDYDTHKNNLSLTRAKYIYDYMVNEGIAKDRMRYIGLGSKEPKIYPEQTAEDQSENRRVVIVLLDK